VFRPRVEPLASKDPDGKKLRLLSLSDGDAGEERKANLKLAWFFDVVALLFVPADHLGRVKDRVPQETKRKNNFLGRLHEPANAIVIVTRTDASAERLTS
jgi:hypothetical protein